MKKRLVSVLLAAVMVTGAFGGCGATEKEVKESTAAVADTKDAKEEKKETATPTPTEEPQEEEEVFMYTLAKVPLRAENKKDSEKLATLRINTEVKVLEEGKTWCLVEAGGQEGYVTSKYLTEDHEEAAATAKKAKEERARIKAEKEAAKKEAAEKAAAEKAAEEKAKAEREAQEEAEAQAAAEAQAEAEAAAAAQAAEAEESMVIEEVPQEKYEVSRENFDDCDGSGHGYTEIHYSDGSVETIEY